MENVFPKKIIKRDGTSVPFNSQKIENAIYRAALEALHNEKEAKNVSEQTTRRILERIKERAATTLQSTVESIQDVVEEVLMETGHHLTAKHYILYRKRHEELRETKSIYGIHLDELKLPINAFHVLKKRYLRRGDDRKIIETPCEMLMRVAETVSAAEDNFKGQTSKEKVVQKFYTMMANLEFLPNSPTLMNAGTSLGQLSACFVIPIQDSMDSIFEALKDMAKIHQTGGGTGFNFSHIRPKGDVVNSTKGEASGPISFMSIFEKATQIIVQGGKRRGANMGILRCDHPDILDFIEAKMDGKSFSNFNLSVGVTDEFMEAVKKRKAIDLINPRTGRSVGSMKAKTIFDIIVMSAWKMGDPGLIFLDEMNRHNPTPNLGPIEATNPCGELPLLPYESCNLASINLSKIVKNGEIDWSLLKDLTHWGVRFLDDVIEVTRFPLPRVKKMTLENRKIGLGIMGFADMLIKMGISYASKRAITIAESLMQFIHRESVQASCELAKIRGVFPNFNHSIHAHSGYQVRNATLNTIAPTGSISIIAGCSSGIEPLFALSYARQVLSGAKLFETNPLFERALHEKGLYQKSLMVEIVKRGSIQNMENIPKELSQLFVTTFDIPPVQHLNIQAAFQKHTDNSVSKTINLPPHATIEDVKDIYLKAYQLKCKGITVYRYGSKKGQALSLGKDISMELDDPEVIIADFNECPSKSCLF
ncbi:MAG: adenosylcobalamin-dependent ribonucleoside-diphosphate reductase [bacterium]